MFLISLGRRFINMDNVISILESEDGSLEITYVSTTTDLLQEPEASAFRVWLHQSAVDVSADTQIWTNPQVAGRQKG